MYSNSTPHYNLPLYIDSDYVDPMADFNGAFTKIDAQMFDNAQLSAKVNPLEHQYNELATNLNETNNNLIIAKNAADNAMATAQSKFLYTTDNVPSYSDLEDITPDLTNRGELKSFMVLKNLTLDSNTLLNVHVEVRNYYGGYDLFHGRADIILHKTEDFSDKGYNLNYGFCFYRPSVCEDNSNPLLAHSAVLLPKGSKVTLRFNGIYRVASTGSPNVIHCHYMQVKQNY